MTGALGVHAREVQREAGHVTKDANPEPREIIFRYEKSLLCRVIHVDGAWGGLTPRGDVYMALYSEHQPTPDQTVYRQNPDGVTASEVSTDSIEGVIREIDVEAILTYQGAIALRDWLNDRIKNIDEVRSEIESRRSHGSTEGS